MIQPENFEAFSPFGRKFCFNHPFGGKPSLEGKEDHGILSNVNESDGMIVLDSNSGSVTGEKWKITTTDSDAKCEEEVYMRDRTVVWSKGSDQQSRILIKSFTVGSEAKDCFWCKFTIPSSNENQEPKRSFCVLENEYLNVFDVSGSVYTTALPFPVHKVWVISGGLLLERTVTPSELTTHKRDIPTLFSIMHPLDEPRPVASQTQGKNAFVSDPTMNVIFTSEGCSYIMMYDSVIGLHSIWMITKALPEDIPQSPATSHHPHDAMPSNVHQPSPVLPSAAHSRFSLATPTHSPFKGYTSSPIVRTHIQSPGPIKLMSPALGQFSTSQTRSPFLESPFHLNTRSPSVFRSPPGGQVMDQSFLDFFEPLTPDLSLKLLWQETPTAIRHGAKGRACKVIQTTDVCKNKYLCYLTEHNNRLRVLKVLTNDCNMVFIPASDIPAKDVVPLKKLDMMLVLDTDASLSLYSGQTKICAVVLPTLQVSSSSFNPKTVIDDKVILLQPDEDAIIDDNLLKPSQVKALTDPQPQACYVKMSNGCFYRLGLPQLYNKASVSLCIEVLKCLLPPPVASKVITSFYVMANQTPKQLKPPVGEMERFLLSLKNMMGYSDSGSNQEMQSDSPAAKKFKSEDILEGDEAWETLMNSLYHSTVSSNCSRLFPDTASVPTSLGQESQLPQHDKLDSTALLFNHVPIVVFALHLVYEELKLDVLAKRDFNTLGGFLCEITRDLGWSSYTELYYHDQPSLASIGFSEPSEQLTGQLKTLKIQDFIPASPPNIHQWLQCCLQGQLISPYPLMQSVCKKSYLITKLYSLFLPMKDGQYVDDPGVIYTKLSPTGMEKINIDLNVKLMGCKTRAEKVVVFMAENDFTIKDLDRLPFGVSAPLREAIHICSQNPPFSLSQQAYSLIGREDLASFVSGQYHKALHLQGPLNKLVLQEGEKDDGMEFNDEIVRLRFGKDLRIQEVKRLLQSAKPVRVSLVQKPEVSDHEFIQEQETKLLLMCKRTMALPVGRFIRAFLCYGRYTLDIIFHQNMLYNIQTFITKTTFMFSIDNGIRA